MNPSTPTAKSRIAAEGLLGLVTTMVRHWPRELSLTAMSTLATVERTGPRRITDLALAEGVTQPSMTVLVTRLEEAGLVMRQRDPLDKRATLVALTEAGSARLAAQRRDGVSTFVQLMGGLPADEVATLIAAAPAMEHLRDLDRQQRTQVAT